MKKTISIIIFLILASIIGFFIGTNLYDEEEENKNQLENDIEKIEYSNEINIQNKVEIQTSVVEEKISVNTEVIEEVYYTECDHLLKDTRKNIKNIINMTKEELKQKYPEWEIKEFSVDKVVLYKEVGNYCGEHFMVKDVDGFITIYTVDNLDNIKERVKITEIETEYLPDKDQQDLKEGIKVYTEEKLNKLIEDFE